MYEYVINLQQTSDISPSGGVTDSYSSTSFSCFSIVAILYITI